MKIVAIAGSPRKHRNSSSLKQVAVDAAAEQEARVRADPLR